MPVPVAPRRPSQQPAAEPGLGSEEDPDHGDELSSGVEADGLDETRSQVSTLLSHTLLRTLELSAEARCQWVKVKTKRKYRTDFPDLQLIQQLSCVDLAGSPTPVYSMKASPDGVYLAAGCGDGQIRVFVLISEGVLAEQEAAPEFKAPRTAAIYVGEPIQMLAGHEGEVVDLSWSSVRQPGCTACLTRLEQLSAVRVDGRVGAAVEPLAARLPGRLPALGHGHLGGLPPQGRPALHQRVL